MKVSNLSALRVSAYFKVAEKQSKTKNPKQNNKKAQQLMLYETAVVDFFAHFH